MKSGLKLPLRKLRDEKSLTQEEVANFIGCTTKTYRSWESGEALPRNEEDLISLSKLFNVSIDYILGLSEFRHVEYENISSITGLSEDAISTMIENHCADIVSLLITQPEFLEIVDLLRKLTDQQGIEQTNMKNHVAGIWERGFKGNKYYSADVSTAIKYQADTRFRYILDRITGGTEKNG